nr:DAK2 domain-containing protein [Paenibacillus terrigena]
MRKFSLDGADFTSMVLRGANQLHQYSDHVNSLNVFPVPDGDTGTNMNLTMASGVNALREKSSPSLGKSAEVLSKGLLMGARGNSGVILSQLFRGFSKSVVGLDSVNSNQFAAALQSGVDTAYKAVVKPVEGTILTVAKEAAKHAVQIARRTTDISELMREVLLKANEALANTPNQLPVLKQVGVVDSGGQGLVYIYEGFLQAIEAGEASLTDVPAHPATTASTVDSVKHTVSAQSQLSTEDIEFLYDMEFFIQLNLGKPQKKFDEHQFRKALAKNGDSIIVIADQEIVKVHVHSKAPGDVLSESLQYGELIKINILNMREQHRDLLADGGDVTPMPELYPAIDREEAGTVETVVEPPADELAAYGMISVSMGQGISDIFTSLGVDVVLSGGQTMNPSTEDFVKAIASISAQHILILPNNSNIILAAQQAKELVTDREVTVLPSKTIPQGLAAAFAFQEDETVEVNIEAMGQAISHVQSGQVTYSIRDTSLDGLEIKAGHYIGIHNSKIVATTDSIVETCQDLLRQMIGSGDEIVTILVGDDAEEETTGQLTSWMAEQFPDAEVEIHPGGQPIYHYLFSVE